MNEIINDVYRLITNKKYMSLVWIPLDAVKESNEQADSLAKHTAQKSTKQSASLLSTDEVKTTCILCAKVNVAD